MAIDRSLWPIAAAQHGLLTAEQLEAGGIPSATRAGWVASGRLTHPQPRVYGLAGVPPSFERDCAAALLAAGPGAALSHRSAAWLWGLVEESPPVELSVPRGRTPALRHVIVHQTRDPFQVHHTRNLGVTSPMRTVLDLGAVVPDWVVDRALDAGLVKKLYSIAGVEWQLVELARKGRRGCGALRRVLDARALGRDRPDGMLEPRFARLRVRAGLPEPVYQYRIGGYRVDFAYPALKIAIEIDDYWSHGTHEAFERDRERRNALTLQGWTILHFTWKDIVTRPEYVARVVASAIGQA